MPATEPTAELAASDAAVRFAQQVRSVHRKKSHRGSPQRRKDIKIAQARLNDAMRPLRSLIGKFPYGPQTATAESNRQKIYDASKAIQAERRKLWKMAATRKDRNESGTD